ELAGVELFAGLDPADLGRLAERTSVQRVVRGQVLFLEGEPSDTFFLVRSGRLRVFRDSVQGDELTLSFVEPGATIGELSVVDEQPRSASVDAIESSVLLSVPSGVVRDVLLANPVSAWHVAQQLAARVRHLTDTTADLVLLDLPRRLGKLILEQAVDGEGGRPTTTFVTSQSGVAAMLGVTRQSLNRALAALVRRGWVRQLDGGRLEIVDGAALRRFIAS
ncbi:Crp/Fnr family transcriptional regulator, partial [Intrasporangium sp.]|uniref:Crp/Fnr family transcriptional regulator n=1 Tax=Intrasporangium sp. TaxID=1925024 RepID=UPI00293B794E